MYSSLMQQLAMAQVQRDSDTPSDSPNTSEVVSIHTHARSIALSNIAKVYASLATHSLAKKMFGSFIPFCYSNLRANLRRSSNSVFSGMW